MKHTALPAFLMLALLVVARPAFAQDLGGSSLVHDVNGYQNSASKAAATQQRRLSDVISRSNTLISSRITSLNSLLTRIQNDNRLTSDQKNSLITNVQSVIAGLTTLKTKIDADTDVQTAITDEKQIISSYHVYAVLEPKVSSLIIINNMQAVVTRLQTIVPQLQNLITTLQTQGKDVSQLTPLLTDISAQIHTITTTLSTDATTVQNIPITADPSQNAFATIKQDMTTIVKADFTKIQQDMSQMRPLFHQLILGKSKESITPDISGAAQTSPTSQTSPVPTTGTSTSSGTTNK